MLFRSLLQFATPAELLKAKTARDKYTLIETIRKQRLVNPNSRPVNAPATRISTRDSVAGSMLGPPK